MRIKAGKTKKTTIEFFVSPEGNDKWSGLLPEPAPGKRNGPFATIEGAQRVVRALKRKGPLSAPVNINIRDGVYGLRKPLKFGPRDGGEVCRPVTYRAYKNEKPLISGGTVIKNFREDALNGNRVWVAKLPKNRVFKQLFVNGQRRQRTRLPEEGYYHITKVPGVTKESHSHKGHNNCIVRKGDVKRWKNLSDVEVVLFHYWIDERFGIKTFDPKTGKLAFDRYSRMRLTLDSSSTKGAQYFIENVFEALNKPGQWYLDKTEGLLYYLPMEDEKLETSEVVAPRLMELMSVRGTERKKVNHLHFRGLTFAHTAWNLPEGKSGYMQAASAAPAAIYVANTEIGSISDCVLEHLGSYAVELTEGVRDFELRRNSFCDLGGGALKGLAGNERITVADNEIAHGGRVFYSSVGILLTDTGGNKIIHNHIYDYYYTGISAGWKWGYQPSKSFGNIIEYNYIHDIGQGVLTDMGGIYTLGVSTGSRIRFNHIHDVDSRSYGGWGIYLDEGSTDFLVEKNLVYRTRHAGFHQHYGKNNIIRNNIFAFGREDQIERGRVERHNSFTYCRNIVYYETGKMFHGNFVFMRQPKEFSEVIKLTAKNREMKASGLVFYKNLYYNTAGEKMDFDGMTFTQWKKRGHDKGTLVADPKFRNPAKNDYSFKGGSPISKIGFEPFDLSTAGPRKHGDALEKDLLLEETFGA